MKQSQFCKSFFDGDSGTVAFGGYVDKAATVDTMATMLTNKVHDFMVENSALDRAHEVAESSGSRWPEVHRTLSGKLRLV